MHHDDEAYLASLGYRQQLSEECDRERERLLGNFPQALTHVAIVNTAMNLDRAQGPAEQRRKH